MSKIDDGGPAFPHLMEKCQRVNESEHYGGLSIRDHFAAAALTQAVSYLAAYSKEEEDDTPKGAARLAYEIADAMLRERERAK